MVACKLLFSFGGTGWEAPSLSLSWAGGAAQTRHARNRDGDAANTEVLSYPLCFRSFARLSWHLADRAGGKTELATAMVSCQAPPPGYVVRRSIIEQ